MKQYVVDEKTLRYLLYCEMEIDMLERDGVDNWSWYGESRRDTKAEFYTGDWNKLHRDDQIDISFKDIAQMRLDAGEFKQIFIPEGPFFE